MMRMILAASIVHQDFDQPISHAKVIVGQSKSDICKQLKLSGQHVCNLKSYGKTNWTDKHGAIHTLILKEAPLEDLETGATFSIFRKVKDFLCVLLSPLKRLFHPLKLRKPFNLSLMQGKRPLRRLQ